MKVGYIGCGGIANTYARKFKEMGHEVVGGADLIEEKATAFAATFSGRCHTLDDLLKSDADWIHICTWKSGHRPMAIRALEAGYNVFVEKPGGNSYEDTEAIARKAEKEGRLAILDIIERANEAVNVARRFSSQCEITTLRHIRYGLKPSPTENKGATKDLGIYEIEVGRYLTGCQPEVRSAVVKMVEDEREKVKYDYNLYAVLNFGGIASQIHCGYGSFRDRRLEIVSENPEGRLDLAYTQMSVTLLGTSSFANLHPQTWEELKELSTLSPKNMPVEEKEPMKVVISSLEKSLRSGEINDLLISCRDAVPIVKATDDILEIAVELEPEKNHSIDLYNDKS